MASSKHKSQKKAAKAAKGAMPRARLKIEPGTKLAFNHARDRGGIKSEFVGLVPKRGAIAAGKLLAMAKKELDVPTKRSERWIPGMVRRGVLRITH